jgi:hypothetical protein
MGGHPWPPVAILGIWRMPRLRRTAKFRREEQIECPTVYQNALTATLSSL